MMGRWMAAGLLALVLLGQGLPALAQTTVEYIHTDALGSPVAVTNQAGQVIERNDYEPYGAMIGKPDYQGIGYTGHVQDAATGLTYMQQRYYDPICGCFLSVDPVTAYSDPVGQFHRYRYAKNNPYKFTDPDGRYACDVCKQVVNQVKDAVVGYAAEKTVAFGSALAAEGRAALSGAVQDARNFVNQRVVGVGASGMIGAPIAGNSVISPGFTVAGDVGLVANLSSGQIGIQVNLGGVPSIGGGGVASGNFSRIK